MKKRIKLLCSLMAFCVALAALVFGVYAAQTFNYTYNGSITYDVDYGFLQIETSVYKYTKNTLTSSEARAYFDDFSELELVPEFSHYYSTYDGNKLIKENVHNQTINNINLDYGQGLAYFIVVNVKSISTRAIQATVSSSYNIQNSWNINSGNTVIVKNDSGKDIVFASGVTNALADCEGSFSYNINFDLIEDYTPQTTGTVEFGMLNYSTPSFTQTFNEFTEGDDFTQTTSIELTSAQMQQDNGEYAAVANFTARNFSVNQIFGYKFKNIKLYDSSDNLITDRTINYGYLVGNNYDNFAKVQEFIDSLTAQPELTVMPTKSIVAVPKGQEVKSCLYFVIRTNQNSPAIARVEFDVEISFTEDVDKRTNTLAYDYRVTQLGSGQTVFLPGQNPNKNIQELEIDSATYDVIDAPDYCIELSVTLNELTQYIQAYGRYEFATMEFNPDVYGNTLIWVQTLLLMLATEEMGFKDLGYFPIFKEDTTLAFGEQYFTFSRSNWAGDLGTIMTVMESGALSQQEIQALASQYLEPIPTDMDEKFSLPVQVGRIKKMPMQLVAGLMDGLQDISSQPEAPSADLEGLIMFNLGLEYTKREPMVGESLGLVDTKNATISDYIKASQNSFLAVLIMINTGNLLSAIDFLDINYFYYIPDTKGTIQIGGDLYSSYYETADSVMFNANNINLDISAVATKEYKTDNSNYIVNDGVLYTKSKSIGKYPSLKQGGRYDILEGTTKIENNAFKNSVYLSTLVLPKSINSIGTNVFENSNIRNLYVYGNIINLNSTNLANQINASSIKNLYIFVDDYISSNMLNNLTSKITTDCEVKCLYQDDGNGLIYQLNNDEVYVTGITDKTAQTIVIKDVVEIGGQTYNVEGIGDEAFKDCANLTSLEIPNTIKVIGDNAFAGCTSLKELNLDDATLTEFGTGNTREDLIIYTTSSGTQSTIHTTETNAISVDWQLQVDGGDASFEYVLNIGQNSYKINKYVKKGEAGLLNRIMIIFPTSTESQTISLTTSITGIADSNCDVTGIQEQISLALNSNGTYTQILGSSTDEGYYNQYQSNHQSSSYPVAGADPVNIETGSKLRLRIYYTIMQTVKCFTENTLVTMADGTYKNIKDIGFDDLLMVYDFDIGKFGASYPVWIATPAEYDHYYLMEFDDGSTLEIVLSHRLFTDDNLDYEKSIDADYSSIGKKFPRQVIENGVPKLRLVTCTNITRINETCTYYNMATSQAMNFLSNGFIGGPGVANIYTFEKIDDQTYVHNQDQLNATRSGSTDWETGTMFAYEAFDSNLIPYYIYVAYRLGETRNMVNILKHVPPYNQLPEEQIKPLAISIINAYFEEEKFLENIEKLPSSFKVTLSDREQNNRYKEKELFELPTPNNTTNFVGWYNSFDGRIYQPGQSAEIYMNTHFIARYSA